MDFHDLVNGILCFDRPVLPHLGVPRRGRRPGDARDGGFEVVVEAVVESS